MVIDKSPLEPVKIKLSVVSSSLILTNIGFPKELAYSMPYIITTIMLVFFSKWVRPPEHDGIPYDKNDR